MRELEILAGCRLAGRAHRLNCSKRLFGRTAMWATLILPLATTFKAPACLEIVARHVVTGLTAAFQTLPPRPIQLDPKNAYQNKQKNLSTCAGGSFE